MLVHEIYEYFDTFYHTKYLNQVNDFITTGDIRFSQRFVQLSIQLQNFHNNDYITEVPISKGFRQRIFAPFVASNGQPKLDQRWQKDFRGALRLKAEQEEERLEGHSQQCDQIELFLKGHFQQCDQIELFLKGHGDKFSYQSSPNIW